MSHPRLITQIKLASPAQRALAAVGIHTLDDLSHWKKSQLKQLHGIGPNAVAQLSAALRDAGLDFPDERKSG